MLAFVGLHLRPPVRELTRDAVSVESRTLARAQRLRLRALPRRAAAGPIGRAALGFAVTVEAGSRGPGAPGAESLRRLVHGLARVRAVVAVSVLVRPPGSDTPDLPHAADLPTVEVDATHFGREATGLLPDRVYLVSDEEDDHPGPPKRVAPGGPPLALPPGARGAGR